MIIFLKIDPLRVRKTPGVRGDFLISCTRLVTAACYNHLFPAMNASFARQRPWNTLFCGASHAGGSLNNAETFNRTVEGHPSESEYQGLSGDAIACTGTEPLASLI